MEQNIRNGIATYHFSSLPVEGLVHSVFTRLGGVSQGPFASLNLGNTVGDDPAAVTENHRRVYAHLGLEREAVVSPSQVHGNRVAAVGPAQAGQVLPSTDGLVTATTGVALLLRFADCQPILLYDPQRHALGLVHAGWRGVAQGIARRAVEAMRQAFGSRAEELIVGLGPAIGPCCYTVGHNVAAAMGYALNDWAEAMTAEGEEQWRLDLSAANTQQLAAEGVPRRQIESAGLCTSCHYELFYSHRAGNGETGRFGVVALLTDTSSAGDVTAAETAAEAAAQRAAASRLEHLDSLHPPGLPGFGDSTGEGL